MRITTEVLKISSPKAYLARLNRLFTIWGGSAERDTTKYKTSIRPWCLPASMSILLNSSLCEFSLMLESPRPTVFKTTPVLPGPKIDSFLYSIARKCVVHDSIKSPNFKTGWPSNFWSWSVSSKLKIKVSFPWVE